MIEHLLPIIAFLLSTTFPSTEGGVVVSLIAPQASAAAISEVIITGKSLATPLVSSQPVITATGVPLTQALKPQGRSIANRARAQASQIMQYTYSIYPDQTGLAQKYDHRISDANIENALENRLYFSTIPHERLVLKMESIREENGLSRHLLESVRPFHPFYVHY